MLEKKALRDQEAASTREADISMEMDRQKAVLAAQVLNSPFWMSSLVSRQGCPRPNLHPRTHLLHTTKTTKTR